MNGCLAFYIDPGSGTLVWQLAIAGIIGCLFYLRKAAQWIKSTFGAVPRTVLGFFAAAFYATAATLVAMVVDPGNPGIPYLVIFLLGIVLMVYLFSWRPAAFLFLVSLGGALWFFPPAHSFRIAETADIWRLVAYGLTSMTHHVVFRACEIDCRNIHSPNRRRLTPVAPAFVRVLIFTLFPN